MKGQRPGTFYVCPSRCSPHGFNGETASLAGDNRLLAKIAKKGGRKKALRK